MNYLIKFQKVKHIKYLLYCLVLLLGFSTLAQRDIPQKPSVETSIYDEAQMLDDSEEGRLQQKLLNYADTTSTQIVVVTIQSLQGEYEGTYAAHWAHEWGIGQSKKDNGLLILIAKEERKIWITTGYGLEEYLTDAKTKLIIENIILPEFRKGNIYAGLDKGTTAIFQVLNGTFEGSPQQNGKNGGIPLRSIIILFIFIAIIASMFNKRGGGRGGRGRGRSVLWDAIILSSLGRGSFGGGSFGGGSSGGGFSGGGFGGGFGGGGFGGGGAGGSW